MWLFSHDIYSCVEYSVGSYTVLCFLPLNITIWCRFKALNLNDGILVVETCQAYMVRV